MSNCRYALHGLAGLLFGVAFGAARADAGPTQPLSLQPLPPLHARLFFKGRESKSAPDAGEQAAVADVTKPVLTVFDAATTLNVSKATPLFSILIKGTDDLSGIRDVTYFATGPSGQRIFSRVIADYPATSFSRRGGFAQYYSGRLLQPGVWTIDEAGVRDVARKHSDYDQAALAALGNTTFTVVNKGVYDAVAPTLTSGQVLTPTVSLSANAKGTTDQAPFVGVKLTGTDTGSTAVAGLAGGHAAFCLADESRCLNLFTSTPSGGSQPSGTFYLGMQVSPVLGNAPGDYLLYGVVLWDQAGNFRELVSTAFGGTTDFSTLFPTTKITLKP